MDSFTLLANTTSFEVDDGMILCSESSGQLLYLNQTAASIFAGYAAGLTRDAIIGELSRRTGTEKNRLAQDFDRLVAQWRDLEVAAPVDGAALRAKIDMPRASAEPNAAHAATLQHTYRLLDLTFNLDIAHAADARLIQEHFAHLDTGPTKTAGIVYEIVRSDDQYLLRRDGRIIDSTEVCNGLVPLVHGNLLLSAYSESECSAALHAGAVVRNDQCILLPGVSGAGKSTLVAALCRRGFSYCADDFVVLTAAPFRIRGLTTKISLKEGAWEPLSGLYPELEEQPVHLRADRKQVRYLLPPQSSPHRTHAATCIVFPRYENGARTRLQAIQTGHALHQLAEAGYDLQNRMDGQLVANLIDWLSAIPCYELEYGDLDAAVQTLLGIGG